MFTTILCPIDFSQVSNEALRAAASLADLEHAELCVLHVCEPQKADTPSDSGDHAADVQQLASAVVNLCDALKTEVPSHVRSRPILKVGNVKEQILRTADHLHADVIVLGIPGVPCEEPIAAGVNFKPGSEAASRSLGRTSLGVLTTARCPILICQRTSAHGSV